MKQELTKRSWKSRFTRPTSNHRVLLVETDGFTVQALLCERHGAKLHIVSQLQTRVLEPKAAVADLCQQLKQQNVPLPKRALLVSSQIIPALLDLPLSGEQKLAKAKMQELVRWEMEALLSEQLSQWNLGWILIGRGYISEQQRDQILDDLTEHKLAAQANGGRMTPRFGEEALKRQWIKREQLEECLALQESLHLLDGQVECNWLTAPTQHGRQPGLWLGVAMNSIMHQSWVSAFEANQMRLDGLYPATSAGLLSKQKEAAFLIEIQPGQVCCSRLEQGEITWLGILKCCDHSVTADEIVNLCQGVLDSQITQLCVTGRHSRLAELGQELSLLLERPLASIHQLLQPHCVSAEESDFSLYSNLLVAGLNDAGELGEYAAIFLAGSLPPPPFYQQAVVQKSAIAASFILGILATEGWFYWQQQSVSAEIATNEDKTRQILVVNESLEGKDKAYKDLKQQLATWERQYNNFSARKQAVESVLIKRQQFVEDLLPLISQSIPAEVMLMSIEEQEWYQFKLDGWSLSQEAVESFNERLTGALQDWQLYIADSPSEYSERDGVQGYRFSFVIQTRAVSKRGS